MLARVAFCTAVLALVAWVYAPLADVGFLGGDLATLADAAALAGGTPADGAPPDLFRVRGLEGRPLAAGALALACRALTVDGHWVGAEALVLRLANVALLLVACCCLTRFVRRALLPWTGTDSARAGGYASALILAVHPLCVSVVAAPAGVGDLLGLGLAATAAAAFLLGRQERRHGFVVLAVLCAVLCGLASQIAYFLALIAALCEFTSARRHRPLAVRLRTAGTTLCVFAAAASVELALRQAAGVPLSAPRLVAVWMPLADGPSFAQSLAVAVEKLGILIMPVHPFGGPRALGFAAGGVALLAALEPVLIAARSAPRLWGWLLGTWCAAIAAVQLSTAAVRVPPDTFDHVETLFPAAVVMATGLGLSSTALSGTRRWLVPGLVGLSYALLAHAAATTWRPAAEALAELRADLDRAREQHGLDASVLVVDPPGRVQGRDVLGGSLALVLHPSFTGEPETPRVRGLSLDALRLLAREPELDLWRAEPLVIVFPSEELAADRPASETDAPAVPRAAPPGRASARLAPPGPERGPVVWRGEARSPLTELDPLRFEAVRATAAPGTATDAPPRLHWRARGEVAAGGTCAGVWLAGPDGPSAFFEVGRSLAWRLGQEIARLWLEEPLSEPVSAEVLVGVPELERAVRRRDGADWAFDIDPRELPAPLSGEPGWRLELLDLASLAAFSIDGAREAPEQVRASGAALFCDGVLARGGGPIAWSLSFELDGTALARARGRVQE